MLKKMTWTQNYEYKKRMSVSEDMVYDTFGCYENIEKGNKMMKTNKVNSVEQENEKLKITGKTL